MFARSFRQFIGATVLSIPIVLSGFQIAQAEEYEAITFTLVNGTSRTLEAFYVSTPDEETWGSNILDEPLEPGEEAIVTINDGLPNCLYDLKGTLGPADDGSVGKGDLYQTDVEICEGTEYTYYEE